MLTLHSHTLLEAFKISIVLSKFAVHQWAARTINRIVPGLDWFYFQKLNLRKQSITNNNNNKNEGDDGDEDDDMMVTASMSLKSMASFGMTLFLPSP